MFHCLVSHGTKKVLNFGKMTQIHFKSTFGIGIKDIRFQRKGFFPLGFSVVVKCILCKEAQTFYCLLKGH